MRLEDSYRVLDLSPTASDEEVKRAHRDLMKVWHPDRFGRDPELRQKAEEKLKAINEAYEAIVASRGYGGSGTYGSNGRGYRGEEASRAPAAPTRQQLMRRYRLRALISAAAAVFILMRRPTPGGLVVAVILFIVAFVFLMNMRNVGDR